MDFGKPVESSQHYEEPLRPADHFANYVPEPPKGRTTTDKVVGVIATIMLLVLMGALVGWSVVWLVTDAISRLAD